MTKVKRQISILMMLAMIALMSGCERQWTGTVTGSIIDDETEAGIPGVFVTIHSEKNGYEVTASTDADGVYRISDARWGPNEVNVYHPRYENVSKFVDVIRDETVELDFEIDRLTEYVDPELTINVVNSNGDPVNQAIVDLYQFKESSYEYYFFLSTLTTDETGIATILLPRIYEDEVLEFQLRLVAFGYDDTVVDFAVSFGVSDPVLTVTMETI